MKTFLSPYKKGQVISYCRAFLLLLLYFSARQQQGTKHLFSASADQTDENTFISEWNMTSAMCCFVGSFWVWVAFCRDRKSRSSFVLLFILCQLVVRQKKISGILKALLKISYKVNFLKIIITTKQFTAIYYILCPRKSFNTPGQDDFHLLCEQHY